MASAKGEAVTFTPSVAPLEPSLAAWLSQSTLRLRREICWRWHQRGAEAQDWTALPEPDVNRLQESLDLTRYWQAKQSFFQEDATAAYLSSKIDGPMPLPNSSVDRGSFAWVIRTLNLDEAAAFALALALAARIDSATGPVIAACQNDTTRTEPTLALVQRLWDEPERCFALADPAHSLWRYGLLQRPVATGGSEWDAAYNVAPLVAERLLSLDQGTTRLQVLASDEALVPEYAASVIDRLQMPANGLRVLPLRGPRGLSFGALAGALSAAAGRQAARPLDADNLEASLTLAWLSGVDLLLVEPALQTEQERLLTRLAALALLPVTVYLVVSDKREWGILPSQTVLPTLHLAPMSFDDRVARLTAGLGKRASGLEEAIAEASRRFRFEVENIDAVCAGLSAHETMTEADLFAACRAVSPLDAGELAQVVTPRFRPEELVLPPPQERQFREIERAMRSLTTVHYAWGTGRVWNEGGISVLFAGPSGTGKTMAAEVLAANLDIPMYRINLAQIVNKYIGETEKNLERVFDAADVSETLLFFDEADALFGRRTDVRDAHDRYANLEVSYLLERMERFKGLAVLATNRRGDLDDAFLRRLRYIIDFTLPDVPQRRQIWERVIPEAVDASELDFDFLARQFQLSGGNIRSVIFNACLQIAGTRSLGASGKPLLTMETVVVAVKREFDKLQRTVSLEQFGSYTSHVQAVTSA
jgi:hypothetical protein